MNTNTRVRHSAPTLSLVDKVASPTRVLLIQRLRDPFAGGWALPGGFMEIDETAEQAAIRELAEETSLVIDTVHQIGAYSAVDRDPRTRVITVAFLAIHRPGDDPVAADDAADTRWFPIDRLPSLAFDHDQIIADGLALYKARFDD